MDRALQERRVSILPVVFALLAVAAFWMLYPQKWPFRAERPKAGPGADAREAELKKRLENIQPLTGDGSGRIETIHFPGTDRLAATAIYSTKFDCARLEAHYKEEFARHGFTFTGIEQSSETGNRALSFSSPDYDATLSCTDTAGASRPYFIFMWSNARD
jgi:hypothetical protein